MADPSYLRGLVSGMQLADAGFPSGRYTLSHGLESFAQSGLVGRHSTPAELAELLADQLLFSAGPSDGVALACAHRATGEDGLDDLQLLVAADTRLTAVKLAREARESSTRTGRALLATAVRAFGGAAVREYNALVREGGCPGNHAVAAGVVAASLGVSRADAVAGDLYAFAANWVAATVRLGLTDHRTAQRVLHLVRPAIVQAAADAEGAGPADITSSAPLVDVMSMLHEEADLRLFAS